MHDPANNPALPDPSPPAWLLGPADLSAVNADDRLLDALRSGEPLDSNDPTARLLAAWLVEVATGTTSTTAAVAR